jgi:hypothetical protein
LRARGCRRRCFRIARLVCDRAGLTPGTDLPILPFTFASRTPSVPSPAQASLNRWRRAPAETAVVYRRAVEFHILAEAHRGEAPFGLPDLAAIRRWVEGEVDLSDLAGRGVFTRWTDADVFRSVRVGSHGAIEWGADIDLCPDAALHAADGQVAGGTPAGAQVGPRGCLKSAASTASSSRCSSPITSRRIFTRSTVSTRRGSPTPSARPRESRSSSRLPARHPAFR